MEIKILSSLNKIKERNSVLIIGTHDGIFHSDEVVACAILCLANPNMSVQILRSRDPEMLKLCDICIDIGGGEFDHHQPNFNRTRKNGIKYASAGLVWEIYGIDVIETILKKYFPITNCNRYSLVKDFDNSCITLIDCEDNGIPSEKHDLDFISSFLPLWFDTTINKYNTQFYKALLTSISVLEEKLKSTISKELATLQIAQNFMDSNFCMNGVLEIPSQTMDWVEAVVNINNCTEKENQINFVIFPYPAGGWAAQCVPPSLENKFEQRISFPKEWAGETKKLPEISGVADATFCHNGRFFVRASSKDAITELCIIATNLAN